MYYIQLFYYVFGAIIFNLSK